MRVTKKLNVLNDGQNQKKYYDTHSINHPQRRQFPILRKPVDVVQRRTPGLPKSSLPAEQIRQVRHPGICHLPGQADTGEI